MISTNIDGTSGATGQLFDLLTVVADPKAYQAKIKALEDATAENKKFVELVGPASDIVSLKEKALADTEAAKAALAEAKQKAGELVKAANEKAAGIVADAQAQGAALKQAAQAELDEAKAAKAEAKSAAKAATTRQAEARSEEHTSELQSH